jgi:HD-GYP domain-containing protein (c-di-GMP phosphodiesterase class II)
MTMLNKSIGRPMDRERLTAARDLAFALFMMIKAARLYDTNNESYLNQSARFFDLLKNYMGDHDNISIKVVDKHLFVDDEFLSIETDERTGSKEVVRRWAEFDFGGIIIGDTVTQEQLNAFAAMLWILDPPEKEPREKLKVKLAELGIDSISLITRQTLMDSPKISPEDRRQIRRQARNTFFRALSTVKEVLSSAADKKHIPVSRTRRVIHSIIDQISQDDAALIELASIKDFDEYTYAHCNNVCIYALTLGFHLGLSPRELLELGLAAIFHDVGKAKLPPDLINKPEKFNEFEWDQMRKHPIYGAMTIAKTMKLDSGMARAMAVAFEHHINPDHSGYPTLPDDRPTNLYSRIVSIVDNFDALSSGRIYIKDPIPPDEVMRRLMNQMRVKFDSLLLKLFVGIIGIYPVGTLVLLSNDSFGIISRTNQENLYRPELYIIADREGEKTEPILIDLSREENHEIDIVRIIEPEKYGLKLSKYILAD